MHAMFVHRLVVLVAATGFTLVSSFVPLSSVNFLEDKRSMDAAVVDTASKFFTSSSSSISSVFSVRLNMAAKSTKSAKSTTNKNKKEIAIPFEKELGATAPLGFFDPIGLVSDGDQDKFNRLRYVEIKHGRISMLAVVGYLVQESGTRLPGAIDYSGTTFASIPNGFKALSTMPVAGLYQIIAFIGLLEIAIMKDINGTGEFVGDFRNNFIDFGWNVFTPEEQERKRTIEINQGRAAMMGILSLMVHDQLGVSIIPF